MIVAPHGRGLGHYALGILLNVVVFAAVGPLIGAIAASLALVVATGQLSAGLGTLPLTVLIAVPTAYWTATPAAALAGLIVAITTSFVHRPLWYYMLAALTGAGCAIVLPRLVGEPSNLMIALLPVAGAAAAVVCARIARPFRLARPDAERLVSAGEAP